MTARDDDPPVEPTPTARDRAMRDEEARALAESGLGSGLLAQQDAPSTAEHVAVPKICPQCGTEYETAARFCPADGTALRPKGSDSLIGRVLADRYHILSRIGEGGMGRVYLGEHVKMNRQCAIKVMSPTLLHDGESAVRFAREASSAARIIHPNVAAVFDYGESDGVVYIVMEYVDGEPLSRLLAREAPFTVDRAVDLARQVADGLAAAHELGIVHRDLKPDNILVTRNRSGREIAKVVDFGIAKALEGGSSGETLTRTGLVIGTPEFMSPEQLLGDPVDARTDLYALGCILHLMLTATPIFEAPTREQMIKRRLSEEPPRLQSIDPGIPDALDRIEARLLARAAGDRYASAIEVRDALNGQHQRRSGAAELLRLARVTPRSAPTMALEAATSPTTRKIVAQRPAGRRSLITIVAGGVIAIAAAVVMPGRPDAVEEERRRSVARDSQLAAARRQARQDSQRAVATSGGGAGAVLPPAVPMVDSSRLRAQEARRRQQDSLRQLAALTSGPRAALDRYARAIASGSTDQLRAAFPGISAAQSETWQRNVFSIADRIRARMRYGTVSIARDTATVRYTLRLDFTYKASGNAGTQSIPGQATLVRSGAGWRIVAIR